MFDAMKNVITVGDTVIVGASGRGAAELLFAQVKSIGPKRVTLVALDGHPHTLPAWANHWSREPKDVLVVQL